MSEKSKIKGYVVRGLKRGGDARIATGLCLTADDACSEAVIFREDGHTDVRILAVAEDGTETPLPSYEEALAVLGSARRTIPEEYRGYGSLHLSIAAMLGEYDGARAEIERLRGVVDLARRLIRSADIDTTSGTRAGVTCDEEPYAALVAIFEAEREAERLIPGLVCAECDRPIYRGSAYGGKGGHAAHRACRNWPAGTVFRIAGAQEGPAS